MDDDFLNSSDITIEVYHEDEWELERIFNWSLHFYPHLNAELITDDDLNDPPLELRVTFQMRDQMDEWLSEWSHLDLSWWDVTNR